MMARSRNIKPGFFRNEQLAECSFAARLLFAGLWTLADRDGRLEFRPKRIKADLFPFDAVEIPELAVELHGQKLIEMYEVDGQAYLSIPGFQKHQRPHPKEPPSVIPQLPAAQTTSGKAVEKHGEPRKETAGCAFPSSNPHPSNPLIPSTEAVEKHGRGNSGPQLHPEMIPIPDALNEPAFLAAWARWLEHLRQKGNRMSQLTLQDQLTEAARWGSQKSIEAIGHSIKAGYIGLFEQNKNSKGKSDDRNGPGKQYDPSTAGKPVVGW